MKRMFASPARTAGARAFSAVGMDFLYNPTETHSMLRDSISKFAKEKVKPQAREQDALGKLNRTLFNELGELGAFGVTIPEKDGGLGLDATAACIIHHELSRYDVGFCLAYLAHSMLFVNNFYYAANDAQRAKWLAPTITGEKLAAMGMSEPGAGTDVLGMRTTAEKKGAKYIINGGKTWITNGTDADVFLVYAKVEGKITSFVLEKGMPGFTTGAKIDKCGMRGSEMCPLYFDNVEVPAENMLGAEGKGVVHMMRNLEIERVTLAAMACGIAEESVELMTQYAKDRVAFGTPINQFGQIQRYIADGFAQTEAAKALTYAVARNCAPGTQNRIGTDAAKLFATPAAKKIADDAMQVMGGMGYTKDMPVERLWRDAKLLEIGGGTLEAHQKNLCKDLTSML